jgi:hypothetical protein
MRLHDFYRRDFLVADQFGEPGGVLGNKFGAHQACPESVGKVTSEASRNQRSQS